MKAMPSDFIHTSTPLLSEASGRSAPKQGRCHTIYVGVLCTMMDLFLNVIYIINQVIRLFGGRCLKSKTFLTSFLP